MKRIITLDFIRGFAIFFMLAGHVFIHVYENASPSIAMGMIGDSIMGIIVLLLFVILMFRSFFLMISITVNSYSMTRSLEKGMKPGTLLVKQLFTGFLLYLIGLFTEGFAAYHGIFGQSLHHLEWRGERIWHILHFEAINSIGLCIMLMGIVFYFLGLNNGIKKVTRNIIILVVLGAIFVALSPVLQNIFEGIYGVSIYDDSTMGTQGIQYDYTSMREFWTKFGWSILIGKEQPLFPFMATACIGGIIGMVLGNLKDNQSRKFPRLMALGGLVLMVIGGVFGVIEGFPISQITDEVHPYWFFLILNGLQLILLMAFLGRHEFNPKKDMVKYVKRTQFFRRWGIISLTVFVLQYFLEWFVELVVGSIAGVDLHTTRYGAGLGLTLLVISLVMVVWDLVIRLWQKGKFIGSFEWLMVKIGDLFFKSRKETSSDRLNIQSVLYNPEPIIFYEKAE